VRGGTTTTSTTLPGASPAGGSSTSASPAGSEGGADGTGGGSAAAATGATTTADPGTGTLAATGAQVGGLVVLGLAVAALGWGLILSARTRWRSLRTSSSPPPEQ
jgi:hypothetical protein